MTSQTQQDSSEQSAEQRRRKRKERAAKSRTPEPKDIVSGAGQPLDPGVRRELEEQLGHDLSRVRLHTGRDAGQLTDLLGADAVAVGQDVFFREGAYRPGTAEGRRLLAHELLHTVQNPHGLGALRAGRELGAVSLPQQAIEREAESAAQDLVRPEAARGTEEPAPEVEEGQATPGWLRYATVDADRRRMEHVDPATLLDRLANGVLRSLRGDPEDRSHRVRTQLARFSPEMQDAVLDRLESRLVTAEHDRLIDLVEQSEDSSPLEQDVLSTPEALPDVTEQLGQERERARERSDDEPGTGGQTQDGSGAERDAGATGDSGQQGQRGQQDRQLPGQTARQSGGGAAGSQSQQSTGVGGQTAAGARTSGSSGGRSGAAADKSAQSQQSGKSEKTEQAGQAGQAKDGSGEAAEGASEAGKEESAAKNRPGAVDPLIEGQQVREEDKRAQEDTKLAGVEPGPLLKTADPGGRSTLEGKRPQDGETDDEPLGLEADAAGELSGAEEETAAFGEDSAWNTELKPEDFLPESDLDVSGVPTADKITPGSSDQAVPSFPQPRPTKAEQVQAQREEEDAEEAASGDDEAAEPTPADGDTHDSPVARAEAENQRIRTLRTEKPVEQEVGPLSSSSGAAADRTGVSEQKQESADLDTAEQESRRSESEAGQAEQPDSAEQQKTDQESGRGDEEPSQSQSKSSQSQSQSQSQPQSESGSQGQGQVAGQASGAASGSSATASGGTGQQSTGGPDTSEASRPGTSAQPSGQGSTTDAPAEAYPARDTHVSGGDSAPEAPSGDAGESGSAARQPEASTPASAPQSAPAPTQAPRPAAAPARAASSGSRPSRSVKGGGGTRSASGGRGGGGARAAAPAPPKQEPAAPNLSQVTPEAGLGTAARLKPHRALEALGGVNGSVDRTVGDEHQTLQSAPPTLERPAGSPQTLQGAPSTSEPGQYSGDPAAQVDAPQQEQAKVEGDQGAAGGLPEIEEPSPVEMGLAAGAQVVSGIVNGIGSALGADEDIIDTDALVSWILDLPTEDDMLAQASVGNAPGVGLEGETDGRTAGQEGELDSKSRDLHSSGRDDAGRPLGEDQIYPDVPQETLTARVPGAKGQSGGGPGGGSQVGGRIPPEAVSAVAEHERGPQLQRAFTDGQQTMSEKRQDKDKGFRESQERHKRQVRSEIETNSRTQTAERNRARDDVVGAREQWKTEQDQELDSLGTKKTEKVEGIRREVKEKEETTDQDVEDHRKTNEDGIGRAKAKAKDDATRKKKTAENDSGNWISEAWSYILDKLNDLKEAILGFFRAARQAITDLITDFKGTVLGWIDEARRFIVRKFREFTEALIQLGRDLLNGLIEIANRIRNLIIRIRDAAIALVNQISQQLRQMMNDLLDDIGKMLSGLLDALREGLRMAVSAVMTAVNGIMDFAMGLLNALGEWAMIAADIITDPGGWLAGAKASAEDGAKNYLFDEVTSAVKNWIGEKIQEILGLSPEELQLLLNGGITVEQLVKEAWDEALPQLPIIIGEIVITKVITKLIPGAGWVFAIIDALKAAWGALSEILAAFGLFMDYLKAVKSGNAGPQFAKAVAAGVVALLELAYEFLLSGIGKYVKRVGDKFKGIASGLRNNQGKPGERPRPNDPARSQTPAGPQAPARPNDPARPQDPTRPNNPNRPQATEQPKPNDRPRDRQEKERERRQAQQKVKQARDDMTRPARPNRPPRQSPPRPRQDRDTTRRPDPRRPDTRRPDSRGPESRRPDDRGRETEPNRRRDDQDQSRPRRDTEGTRPTTRRRTTSPERRAANRDRQTVKSALNRTRRAKDRLGRSDRDDRRRRDLDNNARRMRDAYARRRDLLREQQKRREEQRRRVRDQRGRKENSAESKEERLRRIVARLRPRLTRLLRHGVNPLVLRSRLASWRLWYRLSALLLEQGGHFTARLNPSITLNDPQGKTVDAKELSRLLTPIGREAYDDYVASRQAAISQGRSDFTAGNENALEGLTKIEMQQVLGQQPPPTERITVLPGVRNYYPQGQMPPHWQPGDIGHIQMRPSKYKVMVESLFNRAKTLRIPAEQLTKALATGSDRDIQALRPTNVPYGPLTKNKGKAVYGFQNRVRSVVTLFHSGEPARNNDVAVPQAISSSMLDVKNQRGLTSNQLESESHRVIGGDHAPMAMEDAHRRNLPPARSQQIQDLRAERVGSIIIDLLEQAPNLSLVTSANYDLRPLADAVRDWLAAHFNGKPAEDLIRARSALKAQFAALLKSYDG
ncbi:eCIS core domain-containing protein [Streptomyces acidicola]|uniref:eCIS core domain-containing protein n=1 Tax=Streptomyces acidicola TaxID=2596892 RepID=UPI00343D8091